MLTILGGIALSHVDKSSSKYVRERERTEREIPDAPRTRCLPKEFRGGPIKRRANYAEERAPLGPLEWRRHGAGRERKNVLSSGSLVVTPTAGILSLARKVHSATNSPRITRKRALSVGRAFRADKST